MCEVYKIDATEDTPEILMDADNGVFKIVGRSLPEDAFWFYNPLHDWINNYVLTPNESTDFHFNLEYFNTASAKQIFKIVNVLNALSKTKKVTVFWHYDDGDKDMFSSGERFSKLCSMPFEMIKN